MRRLRLYVFLATSAAAALLASGCAGPLGEAFPTSRTLSAAETTSLTNIAKQDPGLSALLAKGYSAPLFLQGDDIGPRIVLKKCGDLSQEACKGTAPTVEVPEVAILLTTGPASDGSFSPSGKFYVTYPTFKGGNENHRLRCKLPEGSGLPKGVAPGATGLWAELPGIFKEVGSYFTTQKFYNQDNPNAPHTHTKTFANEISWTCQVVDKRNG